MSVHDFFANQQVDVAGLSRYLDGLSGAARVQESGDLSAKEQARLFEAAKGFKPTKLLDFVPSTKAALEEVIHYGRNSLPLFSTFQKRFCKPSDPALHELWGYNEQAMRLFTGPGYFVAREIEHDEVLIDYLLAPPSKPAAWPEILPNSARLSRFVYYRTQDTMRGVSHHVSIGRAARDGKWMDNWFVLCRDAQ